MKKLIAIIMVLIICMPLCACGVDRIKTEYDAIAAVRFERITNNSDYKYVAQCLGFEEYDRKSIEETWRAAKNEMGAWEVTCSGTMTGKTGTGEEQTYKYVLTATVRKNGDVKNLKVKKQ